MSRRFFPVLAIAWFTFGCESPGSGNTGYVPLGDLVSPPTDVAASADEGGAVDAGTPDVPPQPPGRDEVCARWNLDYGAAVEGTWTGNVAQCAAGTYSEAGQLSALRLVNLYRYLAMLPPVTLDSGYSDKAQACSLLMHANNALSHNPPASWACYTDDGAEAAGRSNISTGPAVQSIPAYMVDYGNESTLGHRRWILSNWIDAIGVGSTDSYSCLWVVSWSSGADGWKSWPTPGWFPFEAADDWWPWTSLEDAGWSIQSDSLDLGAAEVTIEANGVDLPIVVRQLESGYGSERAISMVPQGWVLEADTTYRVSVTGIATPFEYEVKVVSCGSQ